MCCCQNEPRSEEVFGCVAMLPYCLHESHMLNLKRPRCTKTSNHFLFPQSAFDGVAIWWLHIGSGRARQALPDAGAQDGYS